MKKIIIVDDHQIIREGLKKIIEASGELVVAAESGSGAEALVKIEREQFDLAVLDLSLPGLNGLDVLRHLKRTRPNLPVLVMSIHPEEEYGLRVLQAGASGYLSKGTSAAVLLDAVRKVLRGEKYLTPAITEKLVGALNGDSEALPHQTLSNREFHVFRWLASGSSVGEISKEMALSVKTVSTYRTRILTKMKMKMNSELIRYALQHSLFV